MRTFIARALWGTLLAGGITLLGATAANAVETTGEDGILSGSQAIVDVQAPVSIVGNAISLIGDSQSTATAAPAAAPAATPAAATSGADGIGSGTQALISVVVPITVSGNAISVVGDSASTAAAPPASTPSAATGREATTTGEDSILGGTQVIAPIAIPINVTGNAISLIGDSRSTGATGSPSAGTTTSSPEGTTTGEDSILGGTQVLVPVTLPITVGGNAISVVGDTTAQTPIVPATPSAPTEVTDPADPATPTDSTESDVSSATQGSAAAASSAELAATGGMGAAPALLMSLGLVAAGLAALASRRRSA